MNTHEKKIEDEFKKKWAFFIDDERGKYEGTSLYYYKPTDIFLIRVPGRYIQFDLPDKCEFKEELIALLKKYNCYKGSIV